MFYTGEMPYNRAKRAQQQAETAAKVRLQLGISDQAWQQIRRRRKAWTEMCSKTFKLMVICAICGITVLGGCDTTKWQSHMPDDSHLTYLQGAVNHPLHEYSTRADLGFQRLCPHCSTAYKQHQTPTRVDVVVYHELSYMRHIVNADPMSMMMLSLVDHSLSIAQRFKEGFMLATHNRESLIDYPLVSWRTSEGIHINDHVSAVYEQMVRLSHPLLHRYMPVVEWPVPALGVPVVSNAVVERIVANARERGPLQNDEKDCVPHTLSTITDYTVQLTKPGAFLKTFKGGRLMVRDLALADRHVDMRMTPQLTFIEDTALNIENTLFPFLFPHNRGWAPLDMSLTDYWKLRMQMNFSIWTLFKPYLLIMAQVQQALKLASSVTSVVLERALHEYMRQHRPCTEESALRHVLKWTIPSSVTGSPMHHRVLLQELLIRKHHYGYPTLFLTLTCDEVSELRWAEFDDMEHILQSFGPDLTWKDAPVECTRLFLMRYKNFMKNHVQGDKGLFSLFGKVDHYVMRFEVQGRGSLHAHILLWIDPVDQDRVKNEISAFVPAEWDAATDSFIEPDASKEPERHALYKMVMRKQMHRCTPWQGHASGCRGKDGKCVKRFPFPVRAEPITGLDPVCNRHVYFRPRVCDRNVIPYHASALLLWGAHLNVEAVTNTDWSYYLMKYTTKTEPNGKLCMDASAAMALGLEGLSDIQLLVIASTIIAKPLAPTEAAMHLLGKNIVKADTNVVYVDTSIPAHRKRVVLRSKSFAMHKIDLYVARPLKDRHGNPTNLEHVTFTDYFEQFCCAKVSDKHIDLIGKDAFGNRVCRNKQLQLVRYTNYSHKQAEGFFFNLLLHHVPFTSEAMLLSATNASRTYFEECHFRGLINNKNDLHKLMSNHCIFQMRKQSDVNTMVTDILTVVKKTCSQDILAHYVDIDQEDHEILPDVELEANTDTTLNADGFSTDVADPISNLANDTPATNEGSQPAKAIPDIDPPLMPLTPEQEEVAVKIKANPHGVHAIGGVPGSGKTYLTNHLIQYFESLGKKVMVTATTGNAAHRLGNKATTAHSAFGIPRSSTWTAPLAYTDPRMQDLLATEVFIVDEMSMLTHMTLTIICYRIACSVRTISPFLPVHACMNEKLFILVGDPAQLPAVCRCRVARGDVCKSCHFTQAMIWQHTTRHTLTRSVRHAQDPELAAFLDLIRTQTPAQPTIDTVLQGCYRSQDAARALCTSQTPILTSHVEMSVKHNAFMMQRDFDGNCFDVCMGGTARKQPDLSEWCARPKFHMLPIVAHGCPVILTSNQDQSIGAVNGATGKVKRIFRRLGEINKLEIELANGECFMVTRCISETTYIDGKPFTRTTFPLALGYSYTIHKAQGATLVHGAILDIADGFAPGMAYVGVSRVQVRAKLFIIGCLKAADIIPVIIDW